VKTKVSVGLLGSMGITVAALVLACATSGGADQGQGAHPTTSAPSSGVATPGAGEPTSPVDSVATSSAAAGAAESGVGSAELVNEPPDGGVVMNNAQPSKDAGSSDRLEGIKDAVVKSRDRFRACFDNWAKTNAAGREVNVLLVIKLDPKGGFVSAAFDPTKSDLSDKTAETCMVDIAKSLTYPESPSGKETTYRHPFVFKARK
jgi:hypothetical protein